MSKSLLLMSCILIGLLVLACGKAVETNRNGNTNTATAVPAGSPVAPPTNKNDNSGASVAQVGVAECDTFITAYENCITTKVPEATRAQFRTSMTTWRTEWKKLADNPQTRPTLVNICKTQMETARTQMKAYGCTF